MPRKMTFETALKKLEDIVRDMESGDLALEQAVKKYEAGIAHARHCKQILDETEKKITVLTQGFDNQLKEQPFDDE